MRVIDDAKSFPILRLAEEIHHLEMTRQGDEYVALCPFHADTNASCGFNPAKNTFHCFGCGAGGSPIDYVMADGLATDAKAAAVYIIHRFGLGGGEPDMPKETRQPATKPVHNYAEKMDNAAVAREAEKLHGMPRGAERDALTDELAKRWDISLTLARYAAAKKLPLEFLRGLGLRDGKRQDANGQLRDAVVIPYRLEDGSLGLDRRRGTGNKDLKIPNLIQPKGKKLLPYGLDRLKDYPDDKIILVEGESDSHTLWLHGYPALGVPGADGFKLEWAEYLLRFKKVYLHREPDDGGAIFVKKVSKALKKAEYKGQVLVFGTPGYKDPSDLHIACGTPEEFRAKFDTAMEGAGEPEESVDGDIYAPFRDLLAAEDYAINKRGYLCEEKERPARGGGTDIIEIPIANFVAWPVREVTRDDGAEVRKTFELEGLLAGGRKLPLAAVAADKFQSMNWLAPEWGMAPAIEPGAAMKDKARHAIQVLGPDVEKIQVYTHTGWRQIGGEWCYLHGGGGVGAENVTVDLAADSLGRYRLPDAADDPVGDVQASLKLLDTADENITIPLLALIYLAPLCEPLRQAGHEPSFTLWLGGRSQTKKSSLAGLFMSHFGMFTNQNLPASFKDSVAIMERKAFLAKDTVLCIDDYYPTGNPKDAAAMRSVAQWILRSYGDRVGRGRMRPDSTARTTYVPRGLAIVTGEDVPDAGQSTTARYWESEFGKESVRIDALTEAQRQTGPLGRAMRLYIEWLRPQMPSLAKELGESFIEIRQRALKEALYTRTPEVVAWLYLGLSAALDHAVSRGAMTDTERDALSLRAWDVLNRQAREKEAAVAADRPSEKFLSALREMLRSGAAKTIRLRPWANEDDSAHKPPEFVGYEDEDYYYLLPETAYSSVCQFYQRQGSMFPVRQKTLWKALEEEGAIEVETVGGRVHRMRQKMVEGERQRFLWLRIGVIRDDEDDDR